MIGWLLSRPRVANWLIERAERTPYFHLDGYMMRYWLFNPYDVDRNLPRFRWCPWSVRIHHILREDRGGLMHNHPWNARAYVLRGFYIEQRREYLLRMVRRGTCNRLRHRDFHRILAVSPSGCWTLFITGPKISSWGYFIPWREKHAMDAIGANDGVERRSDGTSYIDVPATDRRDRA